MNVHETEVPVPWGHIAVKIWGDLKDRIILVVHGIMDNIGSFDRLIALLPKSFCYVCIDLPGHGKSSHFAPFLPIHSINYIFVYRLLCTHFKQDHYTIIGHSYGGQLGLLFAQLYPEFVEKLVMLDCVHLFPTPPQAYTHWLRDKFETILTQNEKAKTKAKPQYTYGDALKKITEGRRNGYITKEAAEALLPRSVTHVGNGMYEFTLDQRLKEFINPLHDFSYLMQVMKTSPVMCPVLILLGRESDVQQIYFRSFINFLKKRKNFLIKIVQGHHDVHNNNPEAVAPDIVRFLTGKKAKL